MLLMILVIGGGFMGVFIPSVVFVAVAGPLGVLVVVLAMLAVGVGATWLYVGWSLAIPSLLVEDTRGWSALQRSLRLVRGRWWPTFAVLLVGFVVTFIVTGVLGAVFLVPFSLSGESTASFLVQGLASAIAEVLTLPFMAALIAIVYFDLRVRKEGLDLELMALGLGDLPPLRGDRPSPPQGTPPPPATPPPTWRPDEGGGAWEDHGRE